VQPVLLDFANLVDAEYFVFQTALACDVENGTPGAMQDLEPFWNNQLIEKIYERIGEVSYEMKPLALMALILYHLPCSDAVVERVFSILREIFGTRRRIMNEDLLEARLKIICNGCRSVSSFVEAYKANTALLAPSRRMFGDRAIGP
jgi:hypothetical protein